MAPLLRRTQRIDRLSVLNDDCVDRLKKISHCRKDREEERGGGRETHERVIEQLLRRLLRALDVLDEVDRLLVAAHVPQLRVHEDERMSDRLESVDESDPS